MGKQDKPKSTIQPNQTGATPGQKDPSEPLVPNRTTVPSEDQDWDPEADEWDQAEAKARAAELLAKETSSAPKEGLLEKAKNALVHALHLDEPDHLSHATPPIEDPKRAEEIREAHKVDLGDIDIDSLPINKVPGKLRKFIK